MSDASHKVELREVIEDDLPSFYEDQLDPEACAMAAFAPRDRDAFMSHWSKILANESVVKRTILFDRQVAGNIVCYEQDGRRLIGYWIGKQYWGRGIATSALSEFVKIVGEPLYAYVAKRNGASNRVLEKCGFAVNEECCRELDGPWEKVEEYLMILDSEIKS